MFFLETEGWREHMEALGIQRAIEHLKARGLPAEWPTKVADVEDDATFWLPKGRPYNKSDCPCYEGYYLDGMYGAVKCSGAGELLPGIVWDTMCQKGNENCPFFGKENADEKKPVPWEGGVIRVRVALIGIQHAPITAKSRNG